MRHEPNLRLEPFRILKGKWASPYGANWGCFQIASLRIISSGNADNPIGAGWEHVSVSQLHRCPNWDEMKMVKELFWQDEETVFQFHPAKSQYVNLHPYVLHLWRNPSQEIQLPPKELIA